MTQATLHIQGMSCAHCVNAVRRALSTLRTVEITSLQLGRADLTFDETVVTPDRLTAVVSDAGYIAQFGNVGR
ncbi:MAG TPA: cation transporter [Gemmatimonadales bacterium]|nr:cation transporter [Gemmatimonadales bacterium]